MPITWNRLMKCFYRLNAFNQNIFNMKSPKIFREFIFLCVCFFFVHLSATFYAQIVYTLYHHRICKEYKEHVDDWLFLSLSLQWTKNDYITTITTKNVLFVCVWPCGMWLRLCMWSIFISLMTWCCVCLALGLVVRTS